eukprot:500962-Rhodomonas_salina.2
MADEDRNRGNSARLLQKCGRSDCREEAKGYPLEILEDVHAVLERGGRFVLRKHAAVILVCSMHISGGSAHGVDASIDSADTRKKDDRPGFRIGSSCIHFATCFQHEGYQQSNTK